MNVRFGSENRRREAKSDNEEQKGNHECNSVFTRIPPVILIKLTGRESNLRSITAKTTESTGHVNLFPPRGNKKGTFP